MNRFTREFNTKCAEFLGYHIMENTDDECFTIKAHPWDVFHLDDLRFDKDFNLLLQVLNKIATLDFGWKVTSKYVIIYSHIGDPRGKFNCKYETNCPQSVQTDVIKTINQFLDWYKQIKK